MRLTGEGYCNAESIREEITEETWSEPRIDEQVPKWITVWANHIDDRIRSRYAVPFPNYPHSNGTLSLANTYFVVHHIQVFLGLPRSNTTETSTTYFDLAERLLKGIIEGKTLLDTSIEIPDGTNPPIIVEVMDNSVPRYSSRGTNPLSIANQEFYLGSPVRRGNPYKGDRE